MGEEVTKPIILREGAFSLDDVKNLQAANRVWQTKDLLEGQLAELFEITRPGLRKDPSYESKKSQFIQDILGQQPSLAGSWVYYPWNGLLVHMLAEKDYFLLRTNRNRNLITLEEQQKLSECGVSVAGMSVGAEIAVSLAHGGVGAFMLADYDIIETANLNRLRAGIGDIGNPKVEVAAQRIFSINPFAKVSLLSKGLQSDNLNQFVKAPGGVGVIFDEIDDFPMKIQIRLAAREAGVPVLMLTSLGDTVVIDVERYDLDPNLEIFNGLLGDLAERILNDPVGEKEIMKYAMQLPGVENIPTRALASLLEINRSLVGRPQLFGTVTIDSALALYMVKRIALGWPLTSGRYKLSLDKIFKVESSSDDENRANVLEKLDNL